MLLLCDDSVILPLKIIFSNIMSTSSNFPQVRVNNVTPIFKKGDKQLVKNYRPLSLLPICGKILEKLFSTIFIVILLPISLLQLINRVFVQVTPQLMNSYILSMKSTRLLIILNPLKFVQYSLT